MSEHKYQDSIELEQAVVDGMDISGHWNKMFVPRSLTEYNIEGLEQLRDIPGAESINNCYQCAKCVGSCPVEYVGSYGPRKIYRKLQTGTNLIEDEYLWLCTTCKNCVRVCPKDVNMGEIIPAAREKAVLNGFIPDEIQEMLQSVSEYGNPMGESARKRAKWMKPVKDSVKNLAKVEEGESVDVLWFVGDFYAYHARGNDAALAMVNVFNKLGVDFGMLGEAEKTDGDSQRLVGESGLFEDLANHNDALFEKHPHQTLLVNDPHAYNAIKKHYPKITGNERNVSHYTQYLAENLDALKKLMTKSFDKKVTFHDPCYLGRHNNEYQAPRDLINSLPGAEFIEMPRNKEQSYCCGGGGGGMWLDGLVANYTSERLSTNRVREAIETGADVLLVCCPYEVSRFEDAVKALNAEGKLQVLDIVEAINECIAD